MRPASQRALVWVVSIAAVLGPAAGIAYLGAVSYQNDRGAVATRLDEQNRRALDAARKVEGELRRAVGDVAIAVTGAGNDPGKLDAALAALAAQDPLAGEPFVLDGQGAVLWPPPAALGDAPADMLARSEPCPGGHGLETCLRELRTQEARARQLDDARRAELAACPEGVCKAGEAMTTARRLYGELARHDDTGPDALLGLARLARGTGDRAGARSALWRLAQGFADRTERGLPVDLLARLELAELDDDPTELLDLYAAMLDRSIVASADVLAAVAERLGHLLDGRHLAGAAAVRRIALDARYHRARDLEARAAALAPDAAELARDAADSVRGRASRAVAARTVVYARASADRIVGVAVDDAALERVAGPIEGIADGARVLVTPVGTSLPSGVRTLASAPLGAAVPHLTLSIVHDRRLADPLDDVIRRRSREHLLFTGGLALLLAIGLLATIRAAARERELARLQSHFVSTVSHELKTPLTSIRMFAEMLREGVAGGDAARQGRYHDVIIKESQRLGLLIANLLDYAQIERGTRRYSQADERIAAIAGEAVDTFLRLQDPDHGNEVRLAVSPEAAMASAVVDREVLVGAVLNLLSNAAKYGGAGKPIDVDVTRRGHDVAITVADRGPGIPAGEEARIFREFYRAPAAYSSGAPGTGLGLALVKRHVEAQGGTVAVASEEGKGARFTIAIPVGGAHP